VEKLRPKKINLPTGQLTMQKLVDVFGSHVSEQELSNKM
jgi:hypothetical protein